MKEQQTIPISRKDAIANLVRVLERCHPDFFVTMANKIDPDNDYVNHVSNKACFSTTPIPQYKREFPDFTLGVIVIPDDWDDTSWHNDVCPSFNPKGTDLKIWVEEADPEKREDRESERFGVCREDEATGELITIFNTDLFSEVLEIVKAYKRIPYLYAPTELALHTVLNLDTWCTDVYVGKKPDLTDYEVLLRTDRITVNSMDV